MKKRFHYESHNRHTGQSPNKMETSHDILDFVCVCVYLLKHIFNTRFKDSFNKKEHKKDPRQP